MDRFLYEAQRKCKAYRRENNDYRIRILVAIGTLQDALDEDVTMAKRKPTDWGVTAETLVAERNRDSLRRDNERLRGVMGEVAKDLQWLADRKNADAISDLRRAEGRADEGD